MHEVELAQPTLLRTFDQANKSLVDVPSHPLVTEGEHLAKREVFLEVDGPNSIRLSPVKKKRNWLNALVMFCFAGLLVAISYFGINGAAIALERKNWPILGMWGFLAGLPLLILLGLLIYRLFRPNPYFYRFDHTSGLVMVLQTYGFQSKPQIVTTYRLQDVVAVQLLNRYYQMLQSPRFGMDRNKLSKSYELNLVLKCAQQPRLHLAVHGDWSWMRQAGRRLAEFMNVPVIDQLCQ